MTDDEIRKHVDAIKTVVEDVDNPAHSERVRLTWASCAVKGLTEIADELRRRIKGDER